MSFIREKQARNVLELMKKYSMNLDAFKSRKEKKNHLYWSEDKKFKIWKHFDEDVAMRNNIFKILCKRCKLMLRHSFVENDINIAKTHLISKTCRKIAKTKNLFQLTIIKSWKKKKYFVDFLNVNHYKDYYKYIVSMNIYFIECKLLQKLLQTFEKLF
jgi:hypothetical protein